MDPEVSTGVVHSLIPYELHESASAGPGPNAPHVVFTRSRNWAGEAWGLAPDPDISVGSLTPSTIHRPHSSVKLAPLRARGGTKVPAHGCDIVPSASIDPGMPASPKAKMVNGRYRSTWYRLLPASQTRSYRSRVDSKDSIGKFYPRTPGGLEYEYINSL